MNSGDLQTDCCPASVTVASLEYGLCRIETLTLEETADKSARHLSCGIESGIASFSDTFSSRTPDSCHTETQLLKHGRRQDDTERFPSRKEMWKLSENPQAHIAGEESTAATGKRYGVLFNASSVRDASDSDRPPGCWDDMCDSFPDKDGDTVLHLAVLQAVTHLGPLIELLGLQDQVNCRNLLQQTPLHLAVLTVNPLALAPLLRAGASLSAQDCHGNTPLHAACTRPHLPTLRALLEVPSDVTREEEGFPQEGVAGERGLQTALTLRNYEGVTCLQLAVLHGSLHAVTLLLRHGADINARDAKSGRTALHFAVDTPHPDPALLTSLLTHPTLHINTRNFARHTAMQLARGRGHLDLVHLLRVHGADWSDSVHGCVSSDSFSEDDMEEELCVPYDDLCVGGHLITQPMGRCT